MKNNSGKVTLATAVAVFVILFIFGFSFNQDTFAQSQNDDRKVKICHNNGQSGNWTTNEVDDDSVDGDGNGDHNRSGHQDGGDIIPPFYINGNSGYWNSRNWDSQGQSIWNNDCKTSSATSTPVSTATPVPTVAPTPTPTDNNCDGECDPTATPVATETPTSPVCTGDQHLDAAGKNCVSFGVPGVDNPNGGTGGAVLGASTIRGQVLGASTMAGTGIVEDSIFNSIFALGSVLTSFGIIKSAKRKN
jgi:hypothetical protein